MNARYAWPLVCALFVGGCGGQPGSDESPLADNASPETRAAEETAASEAPLTTEAPETDQEADAAVPGPASDAPSIPAATEDGDTVATEESEPTAQEPAERFVMLAPGGPLIVDLILKVDGTSPDRLFGGRNREILGGKSGERPTLESHGSSGGSGDHDAAPAFALAHY